MSRDRRPTGPFVSRIPFALGYHWCVLYEYDCHQVRDTYLLDDSTGDIIVEDSWLRARRVAEQGSPGDRTFSGLFAKGGDVMVKTVRYKPGFTTALVAIGWLSFVVGLLLADPLLSIPLLALARVLP